MKSEVLLPSLSASSAMNKPMENASVGTSVGGMRLPLLRPQQEEVHVWVDAEGGRAVRSNTKTESRHDKAI